MNDLLDRQHKYLRYLLVLSFVTFVILFAARAAHGAWYNASWQYRKKITIQSSQVIGGPHSNFPVFISLSTDAELAANARNDGYDILFTSDDEVTKIAHEREKFDGGTGELVAWVKVGSVSSSGNTDIYMYYGNLSATDQQLVAPTKSNVWSDYVGVWHLHDDLLDSTSNNNDGTNGGSTDATGKIADGQQFDGIDDYVNCGNKSNLDVNYITVSFWLKVNSWVSDGGILSKGTSSTRQYWIWTYGGAVAFEIDEGTHQNNAWNPPSGEWQHLALTYDGSNVITYRNGGLETNTYPQATGTIFATTEPLLFGDIPPYNHADVDLDEVRISSTVRPNSAQWIQTEYNNQVWPNTADTPSPLPSPNPGDGFITLDTETSGGGGGNQAPTVDAGSNQTITLPASADLSDASASDSDGPSSLTYTWTKQSGPGTVTFSPNNTVLNPTASFSVDGTYVLKLSVYDGADTGEDTVTITVNPAGSVDVSGYSCNMKITIDNTKVSGSSPLNNFPVLVSLTDDSLKNTGCGLVTNANGDDIIFTNEARTSQFDHEIEKYDSSTGEFVAWVNIPSLSHNTDTVIYVYYGNSGVGGPQENPTAVWDSNYAGVWHLKETPTVDSNTYDSTANNNDGSFGSAMSSGDQESGKIAGSLDFDGGSNDYVELPDLITSNTGTISLWVQPSSMSSHTIFDASSGSKYFYVDIDSSSNLRANLEDSADADFNTSYDVSSLSANQWYHMAFVWRFGSSPAIRLYLDGALVDENTGTTGTIADFLTIYLGYTRSNYHTIYALTGNIDEVRLSDSIRSDDWIKTEYNNQNDPSSFYSVEKNCPSTIPPISEFSCSIPLTIDSSKVSGTTDLVDFPVLVTLTNTSLKTTGSCGYVQNINGYDIIFSDATQTTRLDHEIEKYDGASGELVAWVRVPTLKYNEDTVINIHFGHSSVCGPTENPAAVWGSDHTMVYHLAEPSGTSGSDSVTDSTGNTGGTPSAGISFGQSGRIGDSADFSSGTGISLGTVGSSLLTADTTVSFWIYSNNIASPARQNPFNQAYGGWGTMTLETAGHINWFFGSTGIDSSPYGSHGSGGGLVTNGSWIYVVGVRNSSGYTYDWYKNGAYVNGSTYSSTYPVINTRTFTIGDGYVNPINGRIDEFRVANVPRTADWIDTEYNNQSDPSSFYSVGASSCFLSGFSCNRKITIDSTKVAGSSDLTNFPFLIKIQNDCNLKSAANGGGVQNSSGWDIIFVDSDGITQLDHEIEEYDGTTGDLTAWVRVPTLPYNSDKDIYMHYGKSGLTCDPSNATGVWDSSYEAVYHLNDDFEDSTSHNRDVISENTDNYASVIADGENFGPPDEIAIGNWNFSGDEFTLQAWARFDDLDQDDPRVISKGIDPAGTQDHVFMLSLGGTLNQYLRLRVKTGTIDTSGTTELVDTTDPVSAGNWYLVAGTYDGSNMRLLKDGVEVINTPKTGNLRQNSWPIALGNHPGSADTLWGSLDGKLDEARILSVARSADWLKTEYNNQDDPDSFFTMSQDTCGGEYGFNYQYCKKITVDHTQVNSDLSNFPLLINIAGDDDLKTVANGGRVEHSQGWDIVFRTSGCGNLDHEIEKYDGSEGDLVAWVRIPTLSSSTDTEIYMYYGASNVICSPENPTGVWDSNYAGVWHLDETVSDESTAGTHYDSTGNSNDGAQNDNDDTEDGKIGTGQMFDGGSDWIQVSDSSSLDITGNAITISAWVKSTADQNDDAGIVIKNNPGSVYNYNLNVQSSDQGNFRVTTPTGETYLTAGPTLNVGQWYFLYGIYNGSTAKLYLDGSEVGTASRTGNILSTNEPVLIGRRALDDARYFTGVIDEVHISNVARSTDWMQTEYNNQTNPNFYSVSSCFEQTTTVTEGWEEEAQ